MARILLVEDDNVQVRVMANILARAGHQVVPAASCQQALGLAQTQQFSLVLLDYYLPDGDAPSCARRLRAIPSLRELPIIVITASPEDAELSASFQAGIFDFIRKPARPLELKARVSNALRLYEAQLALAQAERASSLGQLAACVAHEINNPLAAVMSAVQAVEAELADMPTNDGVDKLISLTRKGLARIQSMVADLRLFGRGEEILSESVDPAEPVRAALRMLSYRLCGSVQLSSQLEGCRQVRCHPSLFSQVVVSLLSQLIDRLDTAGGGRINVALQSDCNCAELVIFSEEAEKVGAGAEQRLTWGLAERTLRLFDAELLSGDDGTIRVVFPLPVCANAA